MIARPIHYLDHIGIVVSDLGRGLHSLQAVVGHVVMSQQIDDEGLGVSVRFAKDISGIVYELITPYGATSPISGALNTKSNLLNQLAYRTDNIERSGRWFAETRAAVPLGNPAQAKAFGAPVQFFMSRLGFVVELIETSVPTMSFVNSGAT
jgi:methylmalonyl-CoA/ethylmalonyl-CoA epimerase